MNDKYISVKEYAKRQGISTAEAYSRINDADMKPYVAIVGNIKMISIDALPQTEKPIEGTLDADKPIAEDKVKQAETTQDEAELESLRKQVADLKAEIAEKDSKIEELTAQLADLAVKSQSITENALNIVNQAQILQAITFKKKGFFRRLLESRKENNGL